MENSEDSEQPHALETGELETILFCSAPSDIKHLGSPSWIEWHQRFQKLQHQAVLEAVSGMEEVTRDAIVSNGKVPLLIHEAICISVWRMKIFPKIISEENNIQSTFVLYAVLYHESIAAGLLELVCHDEEACQSISDFLVDLVDYCIEMITGLIGLVNNGYLENKSKDEQKTENIYEELERQKLDLQFDVAFRCVTIVSCLCNILDKVHVSASSRLYSTHDTPMLMAELLQMNPWQRRDHQGNVQQFINGKWKTIYGDDLEKICRHETLVWLSLWKLVLNPELNKYYEMNNFRKTQLCKLLYKLNESTLDQIPVLVDLKRSLGRLGVADVALGAPSKKPVLLEVIPQIKQKLLKKIKKHENTILETQLKYFILDNNDLVEMAKKLSNTYTSEIMERLDDGGPKCANCGEGAPKKCSRCKSEWYCGRECQVKRWGKHRELCDQFALLNVQ